MLAKRSAALRCATACLIFATSHVARAAESTSASTSRHARDEAVRAIPMQRISPENRRKVQLVLNDTSLYRRLPTMTVQCQPALFTHLVQNPDTLVQIWHQLGISNVQLVRTGKDSFRMADNVGTVGSLKIVEQKCDQQAQNRLVLYAEGQYEGKPFKRPVRAQCVLLLRSGSTTETNGKPYVAARLDTFVRIDRASLELFARALHPLVGQSADRNFADTMQFIGSMSQAAETRPDSVARLSHSLSEISADRRQQLADLCYHCAELAEQRPTKPSHRLATASK